MAELITIPGDPGGLQAGAGAILAAGEQIDSVRQRVASNGLQGGWTGSASDSFRVSLQGLPDELAPMVAAFDEASAAVRAFAATLSELQQRAAQHNVAVQAAEQSLRQAQLSHARAQTQLDAARVAHSLATDPVSLATAGHALALAQDGFRMALLQFEGVGEHIAALGNSGVVLREEYETAVRRCCATLDGLRHGGGRSFAAWIAGTVAELLGGVPQIAAWWRVSGAEDALVAEDIASHVSGYADDLGTLAGKLPPSMRGAWGTGLMKMTDSSAFKIGGVFFTLFDAGHDSFSTYAETGWMSPGGRKIATGSAAAGDLVTLIPVAGYADLASGGALSADINAVGLIWGGYETGGWSGASRGLDQFSENAAQGKYTGFVQDMAKGEDFVIEHPDAVVHAISDAPQNVLHAAEAAPGAIVSGVEHAPGAVAHVLTHPADDAKSVWHAAGDVLHFL